MNDDLFIHRCLEIAQKAKGYTTPNPMVGAVLVYNNQIIAEGWHRIYGGPHAEVDCLNNVAPADRHLIPECTMYVNLEPCAHEGKTPPCAHRLVKEGIKKVVIANTDPFKLVQGRGIDILNNAGVETVTGVLAEQGAWVNRRFFCFHQQNRPYIILKWAESTDKFIAPTNRSRFQITNAASRQLLHKWRTEETAIMVGYTTALNDNPALTATLWKGTNPLRIVLDRNLQLPTTHQLFNATAKTWVINSLRNEEVENVRYIKLDFNEELLTQLLQKLYNDNILSLIVEGGAQLLNSFIDAHLWDEARVFTGNIMLRDGIAAPLLRNAEAGFSTPLGSDKLEVFINQKSPYKYQQGMEL